MATRVLDDAYVEWDSTDLSDHVQSVTLNYAAEMLDDTAMGDDTRSNKGGLYEWSVDVEFYADEAASEVAATLFSDVGAAKTIIVRPDNSEGVGATNPNYTGTATLESFPPISGSVGDMNMNSVTFQSAGTLSRATS